MPIEQVKLNAKKLKCPVPATLKVQRGKIGLYRGKFARVEIWTSKGKKPLCVCRNVGGKTVREFFGLDEITYANDKARHYETQGKANGERFGTISNDEKAALMKWRNYVWQSLQAGKEPRSLAEIIGELIEREEHKDDTPFFENAAFQFIEAKDAAGGCSLAYRNRIKNYLSALAKELNGVRLSEVSEPILLEAINKVARPRGGNVPAPKTKKHYIDITKEMFKWWFVRENSTRRPADKLNNPLEIISPPKIVKTKDPDVLTVEQTRAILADLWEHSPEAVPAAVIQLFCGVREAETMRLRWRDIIDGEIRLSCTITKTKLARSVPVPENARAWIDACRARGLKTPPAALIFPFNDIAPEKLNGLDAAARERVEMEQFTCRTQAYSYRIKRAGKRLGLTDTQNAFRHTAASCLAVVHGQFRAADYCGHSIRTQGTNYRNPVSAIQAADYFGIMPPNEGKPAIVFSREQAKKAKRERDEDGAGTDESESRDGQGESAVL